MSILHEALVLEELSYCCPAFTAICGASAILVRCVALLCTHLTYFLVSHPLYCTQCTALYCERERVGARAAALRLRAAQAARLLRTGRASESAHCARLASPPPHLRVLYCTPQGRLERRVLGCIAYKLGPLATRLFRSAASPILSSLILSLLYSSPLICNLVVLLQLCS